MKIDGNANTVLRQTHLQKNDADHVLNHGLFVPHPQVTPGTQQMSKNHMISHHHLLDTKQATIITQPNQRKRASIHVRYFRKRQ
jgi:hypothetical protein